MSQSFVNTSVQSSFTDHIQSLITRNALGRACKLFLSTRVINSALKPQAALNTGIAYSLSAIPGRCILWTPQTEKNFQSYFKEIKFLDLRTDQIIHIEGVEPGNMELTIEKIFNM